MAPPVITKPTTSLVPVLQNIKVHFVIYVIFVTVKLAATMVIVKMEN